MIRLDPYTAPSDIGRDWKRGSTGEQHTFTCQCEHCTALRLNAIMHRGLFLCREHFGTPEAARMLSPEFTRPAWL